MRFTKMHGAGNDYVYFDCFEQMPPGDVPELARLVSDRHKGIGSDGLILIRPSTVADVADADVQRGRQRSRNVRQRRAVRRQVRLRPRDRSQRDASD